MTNDTQPLPGMPAGGRWTEQGKVYVTAIHALVLLLDRTQSKTLPKMPGLRGPVTTGEK